MIKKNVRNTEQAQIMLKWLFQLPRDLFPGQQGSKIQQEQTPGVSMLNWVS